MAKSMFYSYGGDRPWQKAFSKLLVEVNAFLTIIQYRYPTSLKGTLKGFRRGPSTTLFYCIHYLKTYSLWLKLNFIFSH